MEGFNIVKTHYFAFSIENICTTVVLCHVWGKSWMISKDATVCSVYDGTSMAFIHNSKLEIRKLQHNGNGLYFEYSEVWLMFAAYI